MSLIEVRDVEKTYSDGTRALAGVSFDIREGEFVAIMGPSGSGKSTLLHILGFLDHPTAGTYRFAGRDTRGYDPDEAAEVRNRKMGFVFQSFNLLPRADVLENIALPLVYAGVRPKERERRAADAAALVGLSHRLHHGVSILSGGEKQRTAIARALVNEPDILFADEPTGNLDSESGRVILEYLQAVNCERGCTVALITHEQGTAEHAERVLAMRDGRIVHDARVPRRKFAKDGFEK